MACVHAVLYAVISSVCCSVTRILLTVRCSSILLHLCYAMLMAVQHALCACSSACCDQLSLLQCNQNLIDSQVQQHVASPVLSNVDGSAAWLVCACSAACCDQLSLLQCNQNLIDSQVQQHVASPVLCNVDGSAAWLVCMQCCML